MKVGFIGVGNMGGPMCRNIIKRSNHQVTVFDLNPAAEIGAGLHRRGVQVEHRHLVIAALDDVAAHGTAHVADADESDFHFFLPNP